MIRVFDSIRLRLAIWNFLITGLLLLTFSLTLYLITDRNLRLEVDVSLQAQMKAALDQLELVDGQLMLQESGDFSAQGLFVRVQDLSGALLFLTQGGVGGVPPIAEDLQAQAQEAGSAWQTIASSTPHLRLLTVLDDVEQDVGGVVQDVPVLVQVGVSLDRVERSSGNLLWGVVSVSLVMLILTNALTLALAGRLLRPLKQMAQTADEITEQALGRRLPVPNPKDEIGQLAGAFNRLFARLGRAFDSQRRFSSDASHELRTPLTVLQGKLELALRKERSSEEYRQVIASSLRQSQRLAQLVKRLLLLARADSGKLLVEQKVVRLDELCLDACDQMADVAERKKIQLSRSRCDALELPGDEDLLRQAVLNLLDNAIKYTPEGGTVAVSLCRVDGHAQLNVRDSGVGIPKDELPHIFERFYRVDKARSKHVPGTGLGLSIVKEIVGAHGGSISVASELAQGTIVTVLLPLRITSVETSCATR